MYEANVGDCMYLLPLQSEPVKKNFVRAVSHITGFIVKASENGCILTYITQSDARGKWTHVQYIHVHVHVYT